MKPLETCIHLANVAAIGQYVHINRTNMEHLVNKIKHYEAGRVPYTKRLLGPQWGCLETDYARVLYELVYNAVNFSFFYSSPGIQPNCANSAMLHECLLTAWNKHETDGIGEFVQSVIAELATARFTMLEERKARLLEIAYPVGRNIQSFIGIVLQEKERLKGCESCPVDWESLINAMIRRYPGYGEDLFLKRAILFCMMLNRRYGWFAGGIKDLPVPADYQLPKVLRAEGVLEFDEQLHHMVALNEPLIAGSKMEVEIRAATIVACRMIAEQAGITQAQVDDYLWSRRNQYDTPYHLTFTTHY